MDQSKDYRSAQTRQESGLAHFYYFISTPQQHFPGSWLTMPQLQSGQPHEYLPTILKVLMPPQASEIKMAVSPADLTTLALTISRPQVQFPGAFAMLRQLQFFPQLQA